MQKPPCARPDEEATAHAKGANRSCDQHHAQLHRSASRRLYASCGIRRPKRPHTTAISLNGKPRTATRDNDAQKRHSIFVAIASTIA